MRKITLLTLLAIPFFSVTGQSIQADSVYMGAGYKYQVFYDLKSGLKDTSPVLNWDIAHTTDPRGACIRANHMTGLVVFSYPKNGISGWSTFDTTGWRNWRKRYNDLHIHDNGAFHLYSSHPKYDWATYNSTTHDLTGDSLFLLGWTNDGINYSKLLKFWPVIQPSANSNLIFKYANVDGSGEVSDTLYQNSALNKNYKYYAFNGKKKPVREPNHALWDIAFTRYYEPQYNPGSGKFEPYPTMGIESNRGTLTAKLMGTSWLSLLPDTHDLVRKNYPTNFKDDLTGIGSNWKSFNGSAFVLKDTQSYIVRCVSNDTTFWLLHFTGFAGSSTGKIVFNKLQLRSNNLSVANATLGTLNIFPNPVKNELYLVLQNPKVKQATVTIHNLAGSELKSVSVRLTGDMNALNIPVQGMAAGVYLVSVQSGDSILTSRIVIE